MHATSPLTFTAPQELRTYALACLLEPDPATKVAMVAAMAEAQLSLDAHSPLAPTGAVPGRPERPELVPPRLVGRRSMITPEGRAMLVHALAHIEFNAMNLALDALWRFPDLPFDYYTDWLRVGNDSVDFRAGQVDLALHYGDGHFPGLASRKLMEEWLAPVCSPQYAREHGLLDTPHNLSSATVLHDTLAWPACASDAEWRLWLDGRMPEVNLPARSLRFDRADLCAQAAIHHAGVAMGRRQLVQPWVDSGQLVLPFGGFALAGPQAYYLVHAARPLPARVQALLDWLMGQVRGQTRRV